MLYNDGAWLDPWVARPESFTQGGSPGRRSSTRGSGVPWLRPQHTRRSARSDSSVGGPLVDARIFLTRFGYSAPMASLPAHLSAPEGEREMLPTAVREDHRRDRIITAAIDVFAERGFRGTTVDDLVAASEVSFGTFYGLFEGKDDCFLQVSERVLSEGLERIVEQVPPDELWAVKAVGALRSLVELIAEDPMRARVALIEARTGPPEALSGYQEMVDMVITLLAKGRDGSETACTLSPTLEEAIVGGVVWLLHQQLLSEDPESIEATFPELVDIVIGPYVGAEEAERLATLPR